ncbi:alpha/beta fold hydrolase [Methylibium sp.]|uniref:alpha/beta fold hydrolase n=1 Tax=Methylibium sp. TaxID=2067992 RepID=UPI003D0B1F5C
MRCRFIRVVVCLCALWLAGAAGAAGRPGDAGDAAPAPCRVKGLKHEVLCGSVTRALNPAQAAGPTIAVHYVLVPAAARYKLADPVFFFAGGPGQSAIALAGTVLPLFQRLNNRRDLVFIDQRGTGRSAPLACDSDDGLPLVQRVDAERAIQRLSACLATLRALPHGDLRQYTTSIAMADADAVRAALGAPQVNLVGGSYGTRAALDYLRQFPNRVRRMVIDGVVPPDMDLPVSMGQDVQAALDQLFADCEREPACQARHPQLRAHWRGLLAALPQAASVIDPLDGRPAGVTITPDLLASAVRGPLYAPGLAAALPFAIDEAAAGRYSALVGLAGGPGGGTRATRLFEGMHFSVVCAEDRRGLSGESPPAGLAAVYLRPYVTLCRDWPRGNVPPAFYSLPVSPAPVLAFSGTLDPVTPPRHGERVVKALGAKARHVVVPNAGHGVMAIGCAREVVHRFIDAETEAQALAADATCLVRLPRPPAFEPPRPELASPGVAR